MSLTGREGTLSLLGATRIVEDCVCEFFDTFGCSNRTAIREHGAFWVFTKNRLQMLAPLRWNEVYRAQCSFTKISTASVVTDTVIYADNGVIAAYSRTEACAIDLKTQRIKALKDVGFPVGEKTAAPISGYEFERVGFDCDIIAGRCVVPSTSIDTGRHTNNVEYVRFILNTISCDEEESFPVEGFEIRYLRQSHEGDSLDIFRSKDGERFVIKNGGETTATFRAFRRAK